MALEGYLNGPVKAWLALPVRLRKGWMATRVYSPGHRASALWGPMTCCLCDGTECVQWRGVKSELSWLTEGPVGTLECRSRSTCLVSGKMSINHS